MNGTQQITVSSQLKSANAVTDIENHSGKKNRETYAHKNDDIDQSKSHLNAEFDFYDRRDLLEEHYKGTIEKHNGNKNNKTEARRWDLDKYLETFEGKTVKRMGKETKNARWSTASQISYFGGKDSLNDVLEALEDAGATQEEIRSAYLSGYEEYVQRHNEKFTTLPIYHSDVHFDETTPHGHDAIVVMGHTEKGRASDSINNALGEMYGYQTTFAGNQENMARYREENDGIMFDAIGSKLEALGASHDLDFNFEFLRTGQTESDSYEDYKKKMDFQNAEEELQETEKALSVRSRAQKETTGKQREKNRELKEREKDITLQQSDLAVREGSVIARERELQEKEKALAASQLALIEKEKKIARVESVVGDVTTTILRFSNAKYDHKLAELVEVQGLSGLDRKTTKEVVGAMDFAIFDAVKNKDGEALKKEVEAKVKVHKHVPLEAHVQTHVQQVIEDDGPEL